MFPFKWGKHLFFRWWTKKPNQNFSKLFWTTSSCHVCWTPTTSLKEYLSFHFRQKEITAATCYQPLLYLNSFHDHPLWYQYNDAFPPHPQKRVKCFNYLGMSMSALPRAQLISFSFWLRNDWYNYNNHYMISWTKHAFWLNLINDLMEDRHVDDIIIKKTFCSLSLWYKTNRFHVAMGLCSNRSQKTSKFGKSISDILSCAQSATFFFLTTFWSYLWSVTKQTHTNMKSNC